MFDTHCHIQFRAYKDDYEEVIKRCKEKGVIINAVGTQKDTSILAVEFAEKYDNVYATVGLHPIHVISTEVDEEEMHFTSREEEFDYEYYKKLALRPKVIAIGECGLELFHLPPDANKKDILHKQKKNFLMQAKLATELNLPLVIHVRDAYEEMLDVIASEAPPSGVVHCYSSNWPNAQKFLDRGLYLGFTGIITFPSKKTNPQAHNDLMEVVKNCPLDRMLIETDAPYLAPQAYRGKRCEPWMVAEVAKKIATVREIDFEYLLGAVTENAKQFFQKNLYN